jgi:phage baseplate assembly protein W
MSGNYPSNAITSSQNSSVVYLDLNLNFGLNVNQITVTNTDAITVKLVNLLYTFLNSRPFEPEFGSLVPTLIFTGLAPNAKQAYRIESAIYSAINKWMAGIISVSLGNINVIAVASQSAYFISIPYTIVATNTPKTLNLRYSQ